MLRASSEILVLAGWVLAKYLTSLSRSICKAMMVCSTASWWQLAEVRKCSGKRKCRQLELALLDDNDPD